MVDRRALAMICSRWSAIRKTEKAAQMDLERQGAEALESSEHEPRQQRHLCGGCPGRSSHDPPPLKLPSQILHEPALFVMSLGHDRPAGVPLATQ